jgi:hypothetical protein
VTHITPARDLSLIKRLGEDLQDMAALGGS